MGRKRAWSFAHNSGNRAPTATCVSVYIGRSTQERRDNLYRFGKGGGGSGSRGSILGRWTKHRSQPDGKINGTNGFRPYDPVWCCVLDVDDKIDLQIAEGILGKRLREAFRASRNSSTFEAPSDEEVVKVAEAAMIEYRSLFMKSE